MDGVRIGVDTKAHEALESRLFTIVGQQHTKTVSMPFPCCDVLAQLGNVGYRLSTPSPWYLRLPFCTNTSELHCLHINKSHLTQRPPT